MRKLFLFVLLAFPALMAMQSGEGKKAVNKLVPACVEDHGEAGGGATAEQLAELQYKIKLLELEKKAVDLELELIFLKSQKKRESYRSAH